MVAKVTREICRITINGSIEYSSVVRYREEKNLDCRDGIICSSKERRERSTGTSTPTPVYGLCMAYGSFDQDRLLVNVGVGVFGGSSLK